MKVKFIVSGVLGMLALIVSACVPGATTLAPFGPVEGANFRFLVSDEPNDIGDFEHLNVTISRVGVQIGGENGTWLQFPLDVGPVDLKILQGKNAQEIWSGNITPGQYNKVFIYVSGIEGILTDNTTADVKLPSEKLQISKPFVVSENSTTAFVFDITVIKAGKSGKYILKPQIAESGADKDFSEVKHREDNGKGREKEQGGERSELRLHIEGEAQPGADVVLVVMDKGKPAVGAAVTVDVQEAGVTDSDGKITISIPQDTEELEIKATLGEKTGEMELEFEDEEAEEVEVKGTVEEMIDHVWTISVKSEIFAVDVENAEIEGSPEVGDVVDVEGVSRNGLIVASEVEVKKDEGKAEEKTIKSNGEKPSEKEEQKEAEGPPLIPHSLQGRADCLSCHGENGIEPFPADHTGRGNDVCTACHQPS